MAPHSTASLHPHTIPLDTRFHDAPMGGTGRYRIRPGGARRSPLSRAVASFSRKLSRLANAIAPGQTRAEPRLREALRRCSHRVGDLVGELARAGRPGTQARDLQARLRDAQAAADALARLLDAPGTPPDITRESIIGQRLSVHLSALGLDQLVALAHGAKAFGSCSLATDDNPSLQALPRRIDAEVSCQLDHRLGAALDAVIGHFLHQPVPPGAGGAGHWVQWLQDNLEASTLAGRPADLAARLDPLLDALGAPQLVTLARGLSGTPGPVATDATGLLQQIRDRCEQARLRRATRDLGQLVPTAGPLIQLAVDAAAHGAPAVANRHLALYSAVAAHLDAHGLPNGPEACRPFVKNLLTHHFGDAALPPAAAEALLRHLPSDELHALRQTPGGASSDAPPPIDSWLDDALAQREARTQSEVAATAAHLQALLDTATDRPDHLAAWVHAVVIDLGGWGDAVRECRAHLEATPSPASADALARLDAQTRALAQGIERLFNTQPPDLAALPPAELNALRHALTLMGLTAPAQAAGLEAASRLRDARAAHAAALRQALQHLGSPDRAGDPAALLAALLALEARVPALLALHAALGEPIGDEDQRAAFREALAQGVLDGLDLRALRRLAVALHATPTQALRLALRSGSNAVLSDARLEDDDPADDPVRVRQQVGVELTLGFLQTAVEGLLRLQPPPVDDGVLAEQSDALRRALQAHGISEYPWSAYRVPQAFDADTQQAFAEHLSTLVESPYRMPDHLPFDPEVDQALWRDLTRADYRVEHDDGRLLPVLDRFDLAGEGDPQRLEQIQAGVARLAAVCESPEQLAALSQVANQDLWVALEGRQLSAHSPWVVNGSRERGALVESERHIGYAVRRGPDRSVRVRCTSDFDRVASLARNGDPDDRLPLNPDTSGARCTVDLAIDIDGRVSILAPVAGFCRLDQAEGRA